MTLTILEYIMTIALCLIMGVSVGVALELRRKPQEIVINVKMGKDTVIGVNTSVEETNSYHNNR